MLFSKMLTKLIRNKYQSQQRRCLFVAVIKVYREQKTYVCKNIGSNRKINIHMMEAQKKKQNTIEHKIDILNR